MKTLKRILITILISLILYSVLVVGYIIKDFRNYSLFADIILLLIFVIIYHIKRNKVEYNRKIIVNDVILFVTMILSSILFKYLFNYLTYKYIPCSSAKLCSLYGVDYDILLTIITFSSNYILITNLINLMLKKFTKLKYTIISIISIIISIIIFTLFVIVFMKLM